MADRPHPTKAELQILQVLWTRGPLSVRDVMLVLNDARPTGYTSVLKTIQIMTEKGLVERDDTASRRSTAPVTRAARSRGSSSAT